MPVPEASVHEDGASARGKDEIRGTRQIPAVQSEPVTEAMHQATHDQLGLCILLSDPRHSLPNNVGDIFETDGLNRRGHAIQRPV